MSRLVNASHIDGFKIRDGLVLALMPAVPDFQISGSYLKYEIIQGQVECVVP